MADAAENRRGAALVLAAMACYVLNDALVKHATSRHPPGLILALRGLFASAVVLTLAWRAQALGQWRTLARPIVGLRLVLEVSTAATSIWALSLIPLAAVTALMMAAHFMIALTSVALGWESRAGSRVLAALAGFAGVLVVLGPNAVHSGWGVLSGLACAASLAARDLVNRRIPTEVPSVLVATATTIAVALSGLAMGVRETWVAPSVPELGVVAGAALFAALGNYAIVAACRSSDLSAVTPFRYSIILWALLLDYVVWHNAPGASTWAGVALICGSGAFILRSTQSARARQRTEPRARSD